MSTVVLPSLPTQACSGCPATLSPGQSVEIQPPRVKGLPLTSNANWEGLRDGNCPHSRALKSELKVSAGSFLLRAVKEGSVPGPPSLLLVVPSGCDNITLAFTWHSLCVPVCL